MTTYEDAVTLDVDVNITNTNNIVFGARDVVSTLEPTQSTGKVLPKVVSTLEPTQTITCVLPKVTSTLVPTQIIRSSIKMGSVITTLDPIQTIISRMTSVSVTSYLVPVQTIDTSNSILSEASLLEEGIEVDVSFVPGGTFNKSVISTLVPQQGITRYSIPLTGNDGSSYKPENVSEVGYYGIILVDGTGLLLDDDSALVLEI